MHEGQTVWKVIEIDSGNDVYTVKGARGLRLGEDGAITFRDARFAKAASCYGVVDHATIDVDIL